MCFVLKHRHQPNLQTRVVRLKPRCHWLKSKVFFQYEQKKRNCAKCPYIEQNFLNVLDWKTSIQNVCFVRKKMNKISIDYIPIRCTSFEASFFPMELKVWEIKLINVSCSFLQVLTQTSSFSICHFRLQRPRNQLWLHPGRSRSQMFPTWKQISTSF